MRNIRDRGITLIVLVITIIILLILAGISISSLTGSGLFGKANEAKVKSIFSGVKEEFELYKMSKFAEDINFESGTLNAGKENLSYNGKLQEGNIYSILRNLNKEYENSFEIIKGELIFSSQDKDELEWALEMGMKINPYIIIDGELMSSDTNLMLMDENTGTIVIPENVTKIGAGAFRDVTGLRTIVIPKTVKEIGDNAFSGNPTLENVTIEEGVEKIGAYAFQDCSNLERIHMADSISVVGQYCFQNCKKLVEINIPVSLKVIPLRMLSTCTSLTEINIPEGITEIQDLAFESSINIKTIIIPSTVTKILRSTF